jgi:hypothetical protein
MLLRIAERAARTGRLTAPGLQRLTETGLDFLAITAVDQVVVSQDQCDEEIGYRLARQGILLSSRLARGGRPPTFWPERTFKELN